jgi:hypothetical protein
MKRFATALLLVGFAGMAVFGLFVMDFAMGHDDMGCIASRVSGDDAVCPMSLMQMAFHHVSAFQAFSLATIVFSFILGFLFLFASIRFFVKILSFHPPQFLRRLRKRQTESPLFQYQKITRWLALFEHSPSLM